MAPGGAGGRAILIFFIFFFYSNPFPYPEKLLPLFTPYPHIELQPAKSTRESPEPAAAVVHSSSRDDLPEPAQFFLILRDRSNPWAPARRQRNHPPYKTGGGQQRIQHLLQIQKIHNPIPAKGTQNSPRDHSLPPDTQWPTSIIPATYAAAVFHPRQPT